jgi:hypothetical protein
MQGAQPEFWNRRNPQAVKDGAFGGESQHVSTAEAAVYEVAPTATDRKDRRVYRADLVGIRNADAAFIANSRADIDALLAEVDRLQGLLAEGQGAFPVIGEVRQIGWYCEHRYGTPDAGTHKKWDYRKGKLIADSNTSSSLAFNSRPADPARCPTARPVYVRAVLGGGS